MADKRNKGRKLPAPRVKGDWLAQLAETLHAKRAPPGWYTLTQIAQRLNMGRTAARNVLKRNKAAAQTFLHKTCDGRIIPTVHYKL